MIRWQRFLVSQPWKFSGASAEYESGYSADGRCGCCRCCYRISSLVIHMPHKYIIKTLVTCNNSLDWLSECKFLWCASSQTDQSGLWVLADRRPWLLSTIATLIILHASYCRALPFERSNQTADERLNNHAALNVLGIACVCVCESYWELYSKCINFSKGYFVLLLFAISQQPYGFDRQVWAHWCHRSPHHACFWSVKETLRADQVSDLLWGNTVLHQSNVFARRLVINTDSRHPDVNKWVKVSLKRVFALGFSGETSKAAAHPCEKNQINDLHQLLSRLVLHHKHCYSLPFPPKPGQGRG